MSPAASGSSPRLQDQAHAARLVALLSQATPTHGLMASQGVLEALVCVVALGAAAAAPRPRGKLMAGGGAAGAVGRKAGGAVVSGRTWPQLQYWQKLRQKEEGKQQQRLKPGGDDHGDLGSAAASSVEEEGSIRVEVEIGTVQSEQQQPLGPEVVAVMKHAASALSVLAQNPDLHYKLVGMGAVPAMVRLLGTGVCKVVKERLGVGNQGQCVASIEASRVPIHRPFLILKPPPLPSQPPLLKLLPLCMLTAPAEVQSHVLAFLMLIATQDGRHAAVVARSGAVPAILKLLGGILQGAEGPALAGSEVVHGQSKGGSLLTVAEGRAVDFAAAVLASLCRHQDIQVFWQTGEGQRAGHGPRLHPA